MEEVSKDKFNNWDELIKRSIMEQFFMRENFKLSWKQI